jgi:hypothetical protein
MANQKPVGSWKPGVSGNPAGRPKSELALAAKIKEALQIEDEWEKKTNLEIIVARLIDEAKNGNLKAVELIFNRVEGTPIATVRTQEIDKDEVIDI